MKTHVIFVMATMAAVSTMAAGAPLAAEAVQVSTRSAAAAAQALPGTTPLKNRPQFHGNGAVVEAIEQVGSRVVVAGHGISSYTQGNGQKVTSSGAGLTATAPGDPTRVAWTGSAGGQWWSLLPDPDGRHVYAGSSNGVSRFDLSTGKMDWYRAVGKSTSLGVIPGTSYLIVGGYFKGGITALRMSTGAPAPYTVPKLASGYIRHADVQPHGNHWVGVGSFKSVGGLARSQAVMLTLGKSSASVTGWDAPLMHGRGGGTPCRSIFPAFLRDVAFLRSGAAFFLDGTGGQDTGMCDAVSRFNMSNISLSAQPAWIIGTCTDTFWSVASSPDDSYLMVGGHFKCIGSHHNPNFGGMVSRFGIAALNPSSGAVLSWKSDKCRAEGTRVFSWVSGGLAVGYDCSYWGNHEGVNPQPSPQTPRDRFAVLPIP